MLIRCSILPSRNRSLQRVSSDALDSLSSGGLIRVVQISKSELVCASSLYLLSRAVEAILMRAGCFLIYVLAFDLGLALRRLIHSLLKAQMAVVRLRRTVQVELLVALRVVLRRRALVVLILNTLTNF